MTQHSITAVTQKPSNFIGIMAVINYKEFMLKAWFSGAAYFTNTSLKLNHFFIVFMGDSVSTF